MKSTEIQIPPAMRFGDHLALDFLNTVATLKGGVVEWLGTGPQWLTWMVESGLLEEKDSADLASRCGGPALDGALREARGLREGFRAALAGAKLTGAWDLEFIARLNVLLEPDSSYLRIAEDGPGGRQILRVRRWQTPGTLLVAIAEQMGELLCQKHFELVRKCENPACTMWFYDRTKGHQRRWCSQAICGNRAKVAAFRRRQREG